MTGNKHAPGDITLPVKRTTGETIEERLTDNAYHNILPARYQHKDENGEVVETQEELFERIPKNVALPEVFHKADEMGITVEVTPDQIQPRRNESNRQEVAEDVFGEGTSLDDDVTVELTKDNAWAFAYDTVVPELENDDLREHVESIYEQYYEQISNLKFTPNSPTWMGAGNEIQQLSACFVNSPADDMTDIHETAKEAALTFQSGGGVGYDFSQLRPYGDAVGSTGGISSGPITFMRTFDQVCGTIAQGGTRRGAQMGVMHVWHPDIIQFIHAKNKDVSLARTLKLNDPDDFTHNSFAEALEEARDLIGEDGKVPEFLRNAVEGHLSNFNISVGITDDFMDALENDEMFTLKNPRTDEPHIATEETKELYEQFDLGEYVTVGEVLEIPAGEIWGRIVDGAYENGEPGVVYIERMNKTHSFDTEKYPEHQINATNPCGEQELEEYESCLVGDQTVLTDDGVRQIEDFDDGSLVTSDSGVSEIATDARLIPQGEKDVVRVKVDGKMPITCTPDHVFMTDEGEVEAQDLIDEGAKVKWMGNNPLTSTVDMDSEDAWRAFSIGWVHGDGWLTENSIGVSFNAEDGDFEVKERVLEHYHDLFGERKPLKDDDVSYQEQTDASAAFEVADELGFNYAQATERSLPDVFYEYSENEQLAFLRGLFTADAGVGGKTNKQIKYATSSYELADEIQKVLGSFGIQTRRYVNTFDDRNDQIQIKISKASARKYIEYVGLETSSKQDQFVSDGHNYTDNEYLEVVSIEDAGTETVYDLNVPETNVFHTNGMLVHNCNLGHINLSTLVAEQNGSNPDFRAFMEDKGVDPDTLTEEEAQPYVEEFLEMAVNWDDMDERITSGIRFLDNVITMSDFPVEKYNEKVMGNRKVGLGIMGLAQMFIQMGVKYGSPVANEITRQVMTYINHEGKQVSAELADERGVFDEWDKSKYANPTEYPDWFEHHTGLDPDEYEDGFEVRNHDVTTIAPTGCVDESSLVTTDSGLREIQDLDNTEAEFEQWGEIEVGVTTDGGVKEATAVYDNGFTNVKTLSTNLGASVSATPNHRFRTFEDGEYVWKEAGDFAPGDEIVLHRGGFEGSDAVVLNTSERDNAHHNTDSDLVLPGLMSGELAEFLGYYVGDGYTHDDVGVKLTMSSENEERIQYLSELGESVFGVTPTREDRDGRTILSFGGRHLPRYFTDNGWEKEDGNDGTGAANAKIPDEVLQADAGVLRRFMAGLFEADGSASRKVEFYTSSEKLSEQVQTALLSLGHVFHREMKTADELGAEHFGDRDMYRLRGANKHEDVKFMDEIGMITKSLNSMDTTEHSGKVDTYPPEFVSRVRAVDGYEHVPKEIKHRVNQSIESQNDSLSRKTVRAVEEITGETVTVDGRPLTNFVVTTVESVDDDMAYTKDISVPDNNTYLANGFVTHNTTSMVGNTSGGCEPLYNVAFYKNVSQDVQGDEMLVEFDDYFLRTLEANDLDVDAVKREAQELMSNNEFDGADSLETVPDAIGELFITTGELTAKEHAGVQCAAQDGVDASISKTTNAANDSTREDADEVFRYIYENGGKGVTYYRDGTRSKQVLTTRAKNTEFSDMDDDEAAEFIREKIEDVFGDIETFVAEQFDGRSVVETAELSAQGDVDVDSVLDTENEFITVRDRPDELNGTTQRIETGYGKVYVTINVDGNGNPFELIANIGNSGGYTNSFTESLAKTVSIALRSGVDPNEIVTELRGTRSPKIAWHDGTQIQSIPDAIGYALQQVMDGEVSPGRSNDVDTSVSSVKNTNVTESVADDSDDSESERDDAGDSGGDTTALIDSGEAPECPECNGMNLYYSEGCKTCEDCGWSEC